MNKRKISECINVRINVGNYQHIEITKHAEEEISYENDKERIEKEQALTDDLISGIILSMKTIPEKLGKGVSNAQEIEESISKAIPEWLDNHKVPNIANNSDKAKDKINKVASEQKDNKDIALVNESKDILDVDEDILDVDNTSKEVDNTSKEVDNTSKEVESDIDLFEEDEPPAKSEVINNEVKTSTSEATSVVEDEKKKTSTVADCSDTFDFFDEDDDLFDE